MSEAIVIDPCDFETGVGRGYAFIVIPIDELKADFPTRSVDRLRRRIALEEARYRFTKFGVESSQSFTELVREIEREEVKYVPNIIEYETRRMNL